MCRLFIAAQELSSCGMCGLSSPVARGILVPQPGIEPASSVLESRVLNPGPPGKSLFVLSLCVCGVGEQGLRMQGFERSYIKILTFYGEISNALFAFFWPVLAYFLIFYNKNISIYFYIMQKKILPVNQWSSRPLRENSHLLYLKSKVLFVHCGRYCAACLRNIHSSLLLVQLPTVQCLESWKL